jgi:peptidoglycan L-alanyl-D-glutamate endopeptidase CwlK
MFTKITPELVSQALPGTPIANIRTNLPAILEALAAKDCDRTMLIMAIATIAAEADSFTPLSEYQSRYNTPPGGAPFSLYDHILGNQGPPDGERFRGRGYVQLTGRSNYAAFGPVVGVDLVANPDLAGDSKIAAALLVAFLVSKKSQIHDAISRHDLPAARRLVNGGSHGLAPFEAAYGRADKLFPQIP